MCQKQLDTFLMNKPDPIYFVTRNLSMNRTMLSIINILLLIFMYKKAHAEMSFAEAFSNGHTELTWRYRYEFVDSEAFNRNANASTLKTRLNYSTAEYKGMTFFIEVDDVTEVFSDNFNSGAGTSPDRSQFPVVADPSGTEINQAWFNVDFSAHNIKLGRQRIILDNQRFVGGVAFRQNEQTFDAVNFNLNVIGSNLSLSYIDRVNRIFGADVPAGKHDNNTLLVNWSKSWRDQHQLVFFYYDIDNQDVASFSTQTYGASFDTFLQLKDSLLSLGLDYAKQTDRSDNPVNFSANYWRVEAALEMSQFDIIFGREVLSGNSTQAGAAFRTPLATLHAFNGWSDRFLTTPDTGLEDTYIGLVGSYNHIGWYLRYHDFESESSDQSYGTEIDASISFNINPNMSTRLKFAQFNSDGFSVDTQHIWLLLHFNF